MKKLRVLAGAFTCCPPGKPGFTGGEDVLGWNLLQQIAKHHEVWALTNAEDRNSIEGTLREQEIPNIHFCFIGLPSFLRPLLNLQAGHQFYYYLWQIRAYFTARRLHKKIQFDLFHHITYGNDWMASHVGALLPVPYIRGPGGGAHRTPGILQREYRWGGRIWEKFRSLGQWIFRHDPFFVRGQSRASAIMVCNRDSLAKLPRRWAGKAHTFPVSGISSEDLESTAPDKRDGEKFHVLSAGSLIRVKGFGLAIRAFSRFSDLHPDSRLSIFGSGPEGPKLKALVSRLGLEDKINLLPEIPRKQLMSEMAGCDVLLFPSMRDGGGTVVIEAMSVGKPVVCLDIGGPGMHITENCGWKVTPGSPEETVARLAEGLERLYLDQELRDRLGAAGRERAEQHYHWDRLGERLLEIYQQAVVMETSTSSTYENP